MIRSGRGGNPPRESLDALIARVCLRTGVSVAEVRAAHRPRDVTRVVTPGTVIEPELLDEKRPSYLAAWISDGQHAGLAYADVTTGEFAATQLESIGAGEQELLRILPRECLIQAQSDERPRAGDPSRGQLRSGSFPLAPRHFEAAQARQALLDHFQVTTLSGFGLDRKPLAVRAAGAILHYLKETQAGSLAQFTSLHSYSTGEFMALDPATRRNLELTDAK